MNKRTADRYKKLAEEHADFLCEKVFKPAFIMAFIHGAKHMAQEVNDAKQIHGNIHRKEDVSS